VNSLRRAELALLVLLAVFSLSIAWATAARNVGVDFYQFWVVGQALGRADVTNVYSPGERTRLGAEYRELARREGDARQATVAEYRQTLETYSTPFLYAVFKLFSTGDYETDFRNYRFLMLACLVFAVSALARLLGHSLETTLAVIAIFSAWFAPFTSDMRVGNVNSIQLALLAIYLWTVIRLGSRRGDMLGGAILGLGLAFKPNLVFVAGTLALGWILSRRARRLALHGIGAAAGGAAAVAAGTIGFGSPRCWADWLSAIRSLPADIITVDLGNFAPARILGDWFGADVTIVLGLIFCLLVAGAMWRGRPQTPARRPASSRPDLLAPTAGSGPLPDVRAAAAGCLLTLLTPRLAWLHYFVLTIPIFLIALRPLDETSSPGGDVVARRILPALALLGLAIDPLVNVGIPLSASTQGVVVVLATVLLFALALRELSLDRSGRDSKRRGG
jgi:hypothetical protein